MASDGAGNIRFIAVARVADRTIVATHGPKARMEDKAKMVLRSDRVADQKRLSINDREVGTIHYECDAATLYLGTFTHASLRYIYKYCDGDADYGYI